MSGEKYPAKLVEKFNDALVMVGVNLTEYEIRKVIDAIPYAAMREALEYVIDGCSEVIRRGECSHDVFLQTLSDCACKALGKERVFVEVDNIASPLYVSGAADGEQI